jgi:hypothetical protein
MTWIGSAWKATMITNADAKTPGLFYAYTPTREEAQLDIQRVTFPGTIPSQHAGTAPGRWSVNGIISTDFPSQSLKKLASKRFKDNFPDGFELVKKMSFTTSAVKALLKLLPDIRTTTPVTNDVLLGAACTWMKGNVATWKRWMPEIWRCPPGTSYEEFSNTCKKCNKIKNEHAPEYGSKCTKCPEGFETSAKMDKCTKIVVVVDLAPIITAGLGGIGGLVFVLGTAKLFYDKHLADEEERLKGEMMTKRAMSTIKVRCTIYKK